MVWMVALRHHGGEPGAPSAASTPAPLKAPTPAHSKSHIYHGAVPGLEGLTRDVHKAHQAVGEAERSSGIQPSTSSSSQAKAPAPSSTSASKDPSSSQTSSATKQAPSKSSSSSSSSTTHSSSGTRTRTPSSEVESEISQGKTVLLFFWNPKSVDDVAVHKQLALAAHELGHKITIHDASAGEVGMFGQVTQAVHVNQTPTILIINRQKLVSTLSGLTDAFSIKQAVSEAQQQTGH